MRALQDRLSQEQQKQHGSMASGLKILSLSNDNEQRLKTIAMLRKEFIAIRKNAYEMATKVDEMAAEVEAAYAAWKEEAEAAKEAGDDSGLSWSQGELMFIDYSEAMKIDE